MTTASSTPLVQVYRLNNSPDLFRLSPRLQTMLQSCFLAVKEGEDFNQQKKSSLRFILFQNFAKPQHLGCNFSEPP
ncbi:hypothetical protein [Haliscomenobacter sp.]|uniref:hypothetical protein n=1 Tax=Haliscomenobacter sp. TaxID=2717303 RepID=UPI003BA91315